MGMTKAEAIDILTQMRSATRTAMLGSLAIHGHGPQCEHFAEQVTALGMALDALSVWDKCRVYANRATALKSALDDLVINEKV